MPVRHRVTPNRIGYLTPPRMPGRLLAGMALACLAACASQPTKPQRTPEQEQALILSLLPATLADRSGWSTDIHSAFTALDIEPTASRVCAVIAVTQQESGMTADPVVPNLPGIVRGDLEQRADALRIPAFMLRAALQVASADGRTYAQRIDALRTERELSELFDEFVERVPLGKRLLARQNPVNTGGPMQVSIDYARSHVRDRAYPHPMQGSLRDEVFTRRGGMHFGIAHLLDYPVSYDRMLYRFADFNAGHYASRDAAFQQAVSRLTGIALALDGDLLLPDRKRVGNTERAVRSLGARLQMSDGQMRRDLERSDSLEFESTGLYRAVFAMADAAADRPLPRAVLPDIDLHSPKFSRKLTTRWFATRVDTRYRKCLGSDPIDY